MIKLSNFIILLLVVIWSQNACTQDIMTPIAKNKDSQKQIERRQAQINIGGSSLHLSQHCNATSAGIT